MNNKHTLSLSSPIRFVKGIGEKKGMLFEKLGITTVLELMRFYPRDYIDKSVIKKLDDATEGEKSCFRLKIVTKPVANLAHSGISYISFIAADDTASASIVIFGQKWLADTLKYGDEYRVYGEVKTEHFARQLLAPVIEPWSDRLPLYTSIYPLTAGLTQKTLSKAINEILPLAEGLTDFIPDEIRERYSLIPLNEAIKEIHFPTDAEKLKSARKRLAFDELLIFQLAVQSVKKSEKTLGAPYIGLKNSGIASFFSKLPFSLTRAQERVIKDIVHDLEQPYPMTRLLQGDVGSGKTVVAAACAFLASKNGFQCAIMAPTEILARQHFKTFSSFLEPFGITPVLLCGSMTAKEKTKAKEKIAEGTASVIVGTHALLYSQVVFANLGLVITDEQHRFGVVQRARLAEKGEKAHTLVMSATPIPRTLSLILYSDLDLSIIDELPPGREVIDTFCVGEGYRERMYNFIRKTAANGNQVYIICPLVEDSDEQDLKSVKGFGESLKNKVFSEYRVGLLHGKLPSKEKDSIMKSFADGVTQILISTTVIEVGVDVPNAVLMIIENADRFGLSQLHQLRGRVGRGKDKSYCILVSDSRSENTKARLDIMCKTNDGFKIAETDLALRGPGDFIGARQHGRLSFRIADLAADMELITTTNTIAKEILTEGLFTGEKYARLAAEVETALCSLEVEQIMN